MQALQQQLLLQALQVVATTKLAAPSSSANARSGWGADMQPILNQEDALVVAGVFALLLFLVWLQRAVRGPPKLEMHGYQTEFLKNFGKAKNTDAVGALQFIVDRAMSEPPIKKAIFDDFHCVHCGSVKPAEWVASNKGNKKPARFALSKAALHFLNEPLLVPVGKRGEPPKRQVIEGPRHADASKAARCCVDWAIKNYGALADGLPSKKK